MARTPRRLASDATGRAVRAGDTVWILRRRRTAVEAWRVVGRLPVTGELECRRPGTGGRRNVEPTGCYRRLHDLVVARVAEIGAA